MKILLFDNYDSFTYNLLHILKELGANAEVRRNDKISLEEVARYGMNRRCGLLVNSSRGIIYAGKDENFAAAAAREAQALATQMADLLKRYL